MSIIDNLPSRGKSEDCHQTTQCTSWDSEWRGSTRELGRCCSTRVSSSDGGVLSASRDRDDWYTSRDRRGNDRADSGGHRNGADSRGDYQCAGDDRNWNRWDDRGDNGGNGSNTSSTRNGSCRRVGRRRSAIALLKFASKASDDLWGSAGCVADFLGLRLELLNSLVGTE